MRRRGRAWRPSSSTAGWSSRTGASPRSTRRASTRASRKPPTVSAREAARRGSSRGGWRRTSPPPAAPPSPHRCRSTGRIEDGRHGYAGAPGTSGGYGGPFRGPPCGRSKFFEGGRRPLHLEAQVGHEDEIRVGAERNETVAIEGDERGADIGRETGLGHGGIAVRHEPPAVRRLGFQPEERAVQRIGIGGRKEVVRVHLSPTSAAGGLRETRAAPCTGHVTMALP